MSDLKGQMRILEEKNTSYMQTNMELEEVIQPAIYMTSHVYIMLQKIKKHSSHTSTNINETWYFNAKVKKYSFS